MQKSFLEYLSQYRHSGKITEQVAIITQKFYANYCDVLRARGLDPSSQDKIMMQFLDLVAIQLEKPCLFENYHQASLRPIDYYTFGIEMFLPMVDNARSKVIGLDNVAKIDRQIRNNENVFLLANHQIELDPQVISILLEKSYPELAKKMIFVAGARVYTDPMAVPFSLGRNLLCIYSKRHIDSEPDKKEEKLRYNQRTMKAMQELLAVGGACIYIAPSGGRDRPNADGVVEVAPFDPQSLEMIFLMARHVERPTHFYPLALSSYDLLPPPDNVIKELGEWRRTSYTPLGADFGTELDIEEFPGNELTDKKERRQARARYIHSIVKNSYEKLRVCF